MKVLYLLLVTLALTVSNNVFAQKYVYNYDNAGNRIERQFLVLRSSNSLDNKEIETSIMDFSIKLYPNPASDWLHIDCEQTPDRIAQAFSYSYRKHYGIHYYFKNNQLESGFVRTSGESHSYFGVYSITTTEYKSKSGKFNQTIGERRYGVPGLNAKVANDLWGDGGDRWRTGGGKLNIGKFSIGLEVITGDPGLDKDDRVEKEDSKGNRYYQGNDFGDNPDNMRQSAIYVEYSGLLRVGVDSESIRRQVQDKWIHDRRGDARFKWVNYPNRFYFQIGSSGTGLY